ncbi:MAG TPA: GNAT family N-acetyltransferase [Burkholderiaceae bacterium]|nr:GNAT family N-acetyltransferase [Burkholderiaceae bacterium]
MIEFQTEPYAVMKTEIRPLLLRHWEEIALDKDSIPLDPDWDEYDRLAALGQLHILTARQDGDLIGYFVGIVRPHLHYRTSLTAFNDVLYIAPQHRRGRTALRFFTAIADGLRERGVQKLYINTKMHMDFGPLLEFLRYRKTETIYTLLL